MSVSIVLAAAVPSALYLTNTLDGVTAGWLVVGLTALTCIVVTFFLGPLLDLLHWATGKTLKFCAKLPLLNKLSFLETINFDFIRTSLAGNRRLAAKLIIMSVAVFYSLLGCYLIIGYVLGIDLPILPFCLTFAGIYLINAVSPTPGALGFSELGWQIGRAHV